MTICETPAPTSSAPASSAGLPKGRPDRRLHSNRAYRWTFQGMAIFMATIFVVTIFTGALPGTIICGIFAPLFWAMGRFFKRGQVVLYGPALWERDILGRWHYPLSLDRLAHVAYVRRPGARGGTFLLLEATPARPAHRTAATPDERPQREQMYLSLSDYSRRGLERLIAPWVAGRSGIASDELTHLLEVRAAHPRTAGVRTLFSPRR